MSEYNTPNDPPAQPVQEQVTDEGQVEAVAASADAARQQARRDAEFRSANPNLPVSRDANPEVGGESNDYLANVSG